MQEKIPKVKIASYPLGEGDYIKLVEKGYSEVKGYYCWGYVAGKKFEIEENDLDTLNTKILDFIKKTRTDCLNKAFRCRDIQSEVIRENVLEKLVKDLGDKK